MSTLSKTVHNFEDLLAGKIDFNQFESGEVALVQKDIASLVPAIQPLAQAAFDSFKVGASAAVGVGLTALGPLISTTTTDSQVTMVMNLLSAAGIPTTGPLSIAEASALTAIINGLKTGLDRIHVQQLTSAPPTQSSQSSQ